MAGALREQATSFLRGHPRARDSIFSFLNRANLLLVDYPVRSEPRWGHGKPPHRRLYDLIDRGRADYAELLSRFGTHAEDLSRIALDSDQSPSEPTWRNRFTSGLDAIAIYSLLTNGNPARYVEIGSGNSTKFARRAIADQQLRTRIVSIDPTPRAEVDRICDEVIRQPVESVDLSVFDELLAGDVLYVDNSHRAYMNSDVTVAFIDVLPRLKAGVLVAFDDIYLPFDYPPEWRYRYYSEQYVLAAYLLAESPKLEVLLPSAFVSHDPELRAILERAGFRAGIPTDGTSFWLTIT